MRKKRSRTGSFLIWMKEDEHHDLLLVLSVFSPSYLGALVLSENLKARKCPAALTFHSGNVIFFFLRLHPWLVTAARGGGVSFP